MKPRIFAGLAAPGDSVNQDLAAGDAADLVIADGKRGIGSNPPAQRIVPKLDARQAVAAGAKDHAAAVGDADVHVAVDLRARGLGDLVAAAPIAGADRRRRGKSDRQPARGFVDALLLGGDDAHQAQRLVADRLVARGAQRDLAIDLDAQPRE